MTVSTNKAQVVRLEVPSPGDVDGILQVVRSILLKDGVKQISIREGEPISYEQEISPEEHEGPAETSVGFAELKPGDLLRNVRMEEFDAAGQGLHLVDPQTVLFWMVFMLEYEGWVATHLVVSEASDFWKWLGIPSRAARRLEKLLNLRVEKDITLPNEVFLIGGSRHQGATFAEVGFVLKGNVEAQHERPKQKGDRGGSNPTTSDQNVKVLAKPA